MRADIHIGIFDIIIFLGVIQGLFISWFFIKNATDQSKANLYQGLLLLFLSLAIFEEWLNNTGYIVRVLFLTNFSEPFNFAFAPLFYLYVKSTLEPEKDRKAWGHFLIMFFWLLYMVFQFIQPDGMKYNSYIQTKHPDWDYLEITTKISDDPLGLRRFVNQLTLLQFAIYFIAAAVLLRKKLRSLGQSLFRTDNETIIIVRNTSVHFFMILVIFLGTKLYFGMRSDIGGYLIATYISFMIYWTSYLILDRSDFFNKPRSFLPFPVIKYQKSSLSDETKEIIIGKITREMKERKYFINNLASLAGLSKQINESPHHVSQVINERLNKNFFELLAIYRVEYAKELILKDKEGKLTVEELTELVGYNSKSSFNTAFKKYTKKTPSEYRKSLSS
jgi:AraC-like DNA-binding protein